MMYLLRVMQHGEWSRTCQRKTRVRLVAESVIRGGPRLPSSTMGNCAECIFPFSVSLLRRVKDAFSPAVTALAEPLFFMMGNPSYTLSAEFAFGIRLKGESVVENVDVGRCADASIVIAGRVRGSLVEIVECDLRASLLDNGIQLNFAGVLQSHVLPFVAQSLWVFPRTRRLIDRLLVVPRPQLPSFPALRQCGRTKCPSRVRRIQLIVFA